MFKHLILVFSLLLMASCSENYTNGAETDNLLVSRVNDFKLASADSTISVDAAPADEYDFIRAESIAGLKIDMTPKQFTDLLPCSVVKGEPAMWAGMGKIIQEWNYSDCGTKLQLSSPDNNSPQRISSIIVTAPSELKTSRGIGVGSDLSQVLEAYAEFADEADNQTGETFTAGSVYGGLFIKFQDGQVSSLFLGSDAQ